MLPRIFALTWFSYAGYYLCRKNLSVLMPFLSSSYGYTNDYFANVIFIYSLAYAIGQLVAGHLSDRFGPRLVVSAGMFTSALATLTMGLTPHFIPLQALNGLAQACGWSGLVKIMACWLPPHRRGIVMAWWGTNYVIGGFAATIFATYAASGPFLSSLGWKRGAFAPAALLFLIAILFAVFVRNSPTQPQSPPPASFSVPLLRDPLAAWISPPLLAITAMYFCVKLTRYVFLFWLPLYMTQRLHYDAATAGYSSSVFELVGFLGVLLAGYVSDLWLGGRRFPVGAVMMAGLGLACFFYPALSAAGPFFNLLGVSLIGMLTYGPDILMSGAGVQDIVPQQHTASAAGFVNGIGSLGQLLSPYFVSSVVAYAGWDRLFFCLLAVSWTGALFLATQWTRPSLRLQTA